MAIRGKCCRGICIATSCRVCTPGVGLTIGRCVTYLSAVEVPPPRCNLILGNSCGSCRGTSSGITILRKCSGSVAMCFAYSEARGGGLHAVAPRVIGVPAEPVHTCPPLHQVPAATLSRPVPNLGGISSLPCGRAEGAACLDYACKQFIVQ